ncbi:MAG: hypothetical protein JXL97_17345 [Bacteroidales bacterium]|nr:hypothetical protein [Bacteroidales bacterium]
MSEFKAKHYDNSKRIDTFDTDEFVKKVQEYNEYSRNAIKIDHYLRDYKGDIEFNEEQVPFYLIIDTVALNASRFKRFKEQDKNIDSFTTAQTNDILVDLKRYEEFFNEINEKFSNLKRDNNKNVWKAAIKLYKDMNSRNFDKSLLKNDMDIKKLIELNEFAEKLKKAISTNYRSNDLEKKISNLSEAEIDWISSHSDISFDIIEISNLIKNIEDIDIAFIKQKNEKLQIAKDKQLNGISDKNDKLTEKNRIQENTINELNKEIENLKKQVQILSDQVESPHKLAYNDAKKKIHNLGKKLVKPRSIGKEH